MGSVRSSPLASPKPGAAVQARAPRSPEAVGRWCRLGVTVLVVLALLVLLMAVALSIAQTGALMLGLAPFRSATCASSGA